MKKLSNDLLKFYKKNGREMCIKLCEEVGISYGYFGGLKNQHWRPSADLAMRLANAKSANGEINVKNLILPKSHYWKFNRGGKK